VGHGFAINPDRALRNAAMDNGWGVLHFRRPVGLRAATAAGPAIAVVAAVTVAVVVGVVVYKAIQRRRSREA
jgi:hypothetical protein